MPFFVKILETFKQRKIKRTYQSIIKNRTSTGNQRRDDLGLLDSHTKLEDIASTHRDDFNSEGY